MAASSELASINSDACASSPRQAARIIGAFTSGGFPVASAIRSASSSKQRGRGQLAGEHVAPRQEAERELQVHERARVARDLDLASGEQMHRLVVPQLERDDVAVSSAREREPPTHVLAGDVRREQKLESPGECRRGGGVPVDQADRERIEQHVDRPRRHRAGRRRPRGGRDRRSAADDLDVAGHGAAERLEVRLAGELGVEWLETARRAQKQAAGVAAPPLLQRDLGSQQVDPGLLELVERLGLDACQQRERSLQVARIALGAGSGEQALRTVRWRPV